MVVTWIERKNPCGFLEKGSTGSSTVMNFWTHLIRNDMVYYFTKQKIIVPDYDNVLGHPSAVIVSLNFTMNCCRAHGTRSIWRRVKTRVWRKQFTSNEKATAGIEAYFGEFVFVGGAFGNCKNVGKCVSAPKRGLRWKIKVVNDSRLRS